MMIPKEKLKFGTRGIWHKPESEEHKAKDVPCTVLEESKVGRMRVLFIFTDAPIIKGWDSLTYRTATIMFSDFSLI